MTAEPVIAGREHWTSKGDVRLFLWEKRARATGGRADATEGRADATEGRADATEGRAGATEGRAGATEGRAGATEGRADATGGRADATEAPLGTILFVHGSSMASQPTFDLQVPGRQDSSVMDVFARLGYDTWCVDMEGYGRSDKRRDINFDIANGADDLAAATEYIARERGVESVLMYGISSGALRAALFAERYPPRVRRLALDAFVWTGKGSPTLAERRKRLPEYQTKNRRPIDRAFVRSIFERDHPGTADDDVIAAFADAILALDDSVPTGTYVDMCAKLPLVDPARITSPTLLMRGQYDGIASVEDLLEFFARLPNPDKQFAVMPGIAHASLQQKNYRLVHHILHSFFSQPAPVYRGA